VSDCGLALIRPLSQKHLTIENPPRERHGLLPEGSSMIAAIRMHFSFYVQIMCRNGVRPRCKPWKRVQFPCTCSRFSPS